MSATYSLSEGSDDSVLSIHFDVQDNFLALQTFVSTAHSIEKIIGAFNDAYFDGSTAFQLSVLPPRDGTFLSRIRVWTIRGSLFLAGTLSEGAAAGVIRALTGHDHSYWTEQATTAVVDKLSEAFNLDQHGTKGEARRRVKESMQCRLMTELTKGFLTRKTSELEELGMGPEQYIRGLSARNDFYSACIENNRIAAIGFSQEEHFPITRDKFKEMISAPRIDEENWRWHVDISPITIISPVWIQGDKQRSWKGKDDRGKERFFVIEDAHFWSLISKRTLEVGIFDRMLVQWAFRLEFERPKAFRVLRVLEFNSMKLAEPYNDEALEGILGVFSKELSDADQLALFPV